MKTSHRVTRYVDAGDAPPASLANLVSQQREVSALLRHALAQPSPDPPAMAFLAQRVLARAKTQPLPSFLRLWLALRARFVLRPAYAWVTLGSVLFLAFVLSLVPLTRSTRAPQPPLRSFVIYQLPSGSGFFRLLEYEYVSPQESSHEHDQS